MPSANQHGEIFPCILLGIKQDGQNNHNTNKADASSVRASSDGSANTRNGSFAVLLQ